MFSSSARRAAQHRTLRAARRDRKRRSKLTLLESRDAALPGASVTEKTLKRRDSIAPLASRVLKSVFTIETDRGLGSAFFRLA